MGEIDIERCLEKSEYRVRRSRGQRTTGKRGCHRHEGRKGERGKRKVCRGDVREGKGERSSALR